MIARKVKQSFTENNCVHSVIIMFDDDGIVKIFINFLLAGFLFVYMTEDMKALSNLYGQQCLLLDATYGTTKYQLPLFQLVTQTNMGFQVRDRCTFG
jgi:hypothetical protein